MIDDQVRGPGIGVADEVLAQIGMDAVVAARPRVDADADEDLVQARNAPASAR